MKYDHKVIMATEGGLKDGAIAFLLYTLPNDKYYTQKESKAYKAAFAMAKNEHYTAIYKKGGERYPLIEYAIKIGDIKPVGWKISRHIDSDFQPFIEEI